MESINPTQASRVWQRVRGNPPEEPTLEKLLALERASFDEMYRFE